LSIEKLRKIAEEGNSIHANIGNGASKISRILAQAEIWYEQHRPLLVRCNLKESTTHSPRSCVELAELTKAVDSSASDVALDLDEAVELKKLLKRTEDWFERVSMVAPKRSKRHCRATRSRFTVEDLVGLIEEASSLPVDTEEEVKRLQMHLSDIQTWRLQASHELEKIGLGFEQLRETINLAYGLPKEFSLDQFCKFQESNGESDCEQSDLKEADNRDSMEVDDPVCINESNEDVNSQTDTTSTAGSDDEANVFSHIEKGDSNVHLMIRELQKGAKGKGVITAEAEMADLLESVSRWCVRSLKYLSFPREIFDKRFFGAFDRFIKEGRELHGKSKEPARIPGDSSDGENIGVFWGVVVSDQLERLEILQAEREKFTAWCELANQT
jgi:hypothetical protein